MHQLTKKELLISGQSPLKPITADITFKDNNQLKPLVIFIHGFKGFKDWGPWPIVANKFAVEGFCFCKLNFSFNGITPNNLSEITDLEAFGYNNFSKELDDIDRLLAHLDANNLSDQLQIDLNEVYLIGHSRGGGISIIKTSEDSRIKKLVTWASVYDFATYFSPAELMYWKTHGVVYVKNSRTGQNFPMYYQFVEDFLRNEERFVIEKAISKVQQPTLFVHGTNDETVNINAAFQLKEWKPEAYLHVIERANHTFGGTHPFSEEKLPEDLENATDKTIEFLKE
ncbi:MAG: prolyl oligopeptidase family serine peptidase [Roseivirga sp.]|uniref:alpha/beta hydrolase family protein n=1 Tax=Roseivirga sp. TaxID=1964215 RepID=UPI001B2180D8|nr:alpha/beta fold hydrolase [Roseivirga sp.]MBO6496126.1 prolyl oligopeptidase family serine peptidase [Roseivirga sp.]